VVFISVQTSIKIKSVLKIETLQAYTTWSVFPFNWNCDDDICNNENKWCQYSTMGIALIENAFQQ
jgi:hypothetical protein